jgi:hypothetical protein
MATHRTPPTNLNISIVNPTEGPIRIQDEYNRTLHDIRTWMLNAFEYNRGDKVVIVDADFTVTLEGPKTPYKIEQILRAMYPDLPDR